MCFGSVDELVSDRFDERQARLYTQETWESDLRQQG